MSTTKLEELGREELLTTVRSLLAEAEALSTRIAAVNEIGIALNHTFDLSTILRVVASQAKWLLDYDHCSVCLSSSKPDNWHTVTLFGADQHLPSDAILESDNLGYVLRTGQSRLIREGCPSAFLSDYNSQIIIPLTSDDRVTGAIIFASHAAEHYTLDDLRIGYLLALQLSPALRNARQFEQLKQAQSELRLYAQELEARNQELDAYNHTIAHDLKAPMTSVILRIEMIKMMGEDLPPAVLSKVEDIKSSTLKVVSMIDQLLWLTKLRDAAEHAEPVDVNPVIQAALNRFCDRIEQGGITTHIDPNLPPAMGHTQWVEEVFANLISNAIKYMGEDNSDRHIFISGEPQGTVVRYEVRDTGVGIAPQDQAHLFEMFSRLRTVKTEGSGLGLSIVHHIISHLNGKVGVESTPGQGSTFWFTLPAVES